MKKLRIVRISVRFGTPGNEYFLMGSGTGALDGAGIKFRAKGPGWAGPTLVVLAVKGDAVHLLNRGADPFVALTDGILGTTDKELLENFSDKMCDDGFLNKLPGVDCVEGK